MNLNQKVNEMMECQLASWEQVRQNYEDLKNVKVRELNLSCGSTVKLQYNPRRIISSGAKVDEKTLKE